MHFIHEKGSGPDPMPLMISHGWPGSVAEFFDLIEPLAHPERFGGDINDAFTRCCALPARFRIFRATSAALWTAQDGVGHQLPNDRRPRL